MGHGLEEVILITKPLRLFLEILLMSKRNQKKSFFFLAHKARHCGCFATSAKTSPRGKSRRRCLTSCVLCKISPLSGLAGILPFQPLMNIHDESCFIYFFVTVLNIPITPNDCDIS